MCLNNTFLSHVCLINCETQSSQLLQAFTGQSQCQDFLFSQNGLNPPLPEMNAA